MATPFGLRALARKALGKVAAVVARDELFEKPGERAPAAPLSPTTAGPAQPVGARAKGLHPTASWATLDEVAAKLGDTGRPRIVNFWATWCIPCVEEFPALQALFDAVGPEVDTIGVSWDLFDPRGEPEEIREHVENFSIGHQLRWPSLVLRPEVEPAAFFARFGLTYDKIPQTWLLDAQGRCLRQVHGPVEIGMVEELRRLLASPSSG